MPELDRLRTLSLIRCEHVDRHVLLLRIEDRESRNTFSARLDDELERCRQIINRSESIRVVVLTGYDSYFLCGGSKEELIRLHEGSMRFTDLSCYRFAMDCEVPVIAAMQGHAIGGGLALGLFCDLIVLSHESVYTFNFMKYGFTPGMGATCIGRLRLGNTLGAEMLLTARSYRGRALAARGIGIDVVARADVLERSLDAAREMAGMPRRSLVALKDHLNIALNRELEECVDRELAMHELTIREAGVRTRIERQIPG